MTLLRPQRNACSLPIRGRIHGHGPPASAFYCLGLTLLRGGYSVPSAILLHHLSLFVPGVALLHSQGQFPPFRRVAPDVRLRVVVQIVRMTPPGTFLVGCYTF